MMTYWQSWQVEGWSQNRGLLFFRASFSTSSLLILNLSIIKKDLKNDNRTRQYCCIDNTFPANVFLAEFSFCLVGLLVLLIHYLFWNEFITFRNVIKNEISYYACQKDLANCVWNGKPNWKVVRNFGDSFTNLKL